MYNCISFGHFLVYSFCAAHVSSDYTAVRFVSVFAAVDVLLRICVPITYMYLL